MKRFLILSAILSGFLGFSTFALAAEESSKLIDYIIADNDGRINVAVKTPESSAVACGAILIIYPDHPNRKIWLSILLTAQSAQMPVSIIYNNVAGFCQITKIITA